MNEFFPIPYLYSNTLLYFCYICMRIFFIMFTIKVKMRDMNWVMIEIEIL